MKWGEVMRERILRSAQELISQQGLKFTMADLAAEIGTSKRTFYEYFESKEHLIGVIVDEVVAEIKETGQAISQNPNLSNTEKLVLALTLLPKGVQLNDRRLIADLKRFAPEEWRKIERLLHEEWGAVAGIIAAGIDTGEFRNVHIPTVVQMMKGASFFLFDPDFLIRTDNSLVESIRAMADIFLKGLTAEGTPFGESRN